MGFRPFFRDGKLVTQPAITKAQAARMQVAAAWMPVKSSNIRAICWRSNEDDDDGKHGLGVWFAPEEGDQSVYWYDAPYDVYTRMLASKSKGKFLHQIVKGTYSYIGPFPPG